MPPISILLADGDAMLRHCLRRAVEEDPQITICWEAENGLQALLLATQEQPCVALLEAQMPRMDGLETTRILRQRCRNLKIVVMSVYDDVREPALAAGADDFWIKDRGRETLRGMICRLARAAEPALP